MNFRIGAALLLGYALSVSAALAQGQGAAAVSATSGTVVVQKAEGSIRTLAPGSMVQAGDVITTQPNSSARLKFTDGGEVTVSANSQFKIDAYSFNTAAPQSDNLVMSLVKGGLRSLTGLISRRGNPDAYRLQTMSATIGIRGTDYSARLCGEECAKDVAQAPAGARAIAPDITARVALLAGQVVASDRTGTSRPLSVGSAIYQGDIVETRAQSHALLVFLDEGRVTVQPDTRLAVEQFRYEPARAEQGVSVLRLLRGGMRALTGLLAKAHPPGYQVQTAMGTVGIRGTGFDASCRGVCESDAQPGAPTSSDEASGGLFVHTWEGEVEVRNEAGVRTAAVGQTVRVIARGRAPELWPQAPAFMRDGPDAPGGPRPDGIPIDVQQLLGAGSQTDSGLYVLVKDGRIVLVQAGRTLELERGESAYAGFAGELYRLRIAPHEVLRELVAPPTPRVTPGAPICTF